MGMVIPLVNVTVGMVSTIGGGQLIEGIQRL
jgi:hypothetical protein